MAALLFALTLPTTSGRYAPKRSYLKRTLEKRGREAAVREMECAQSYNKQMAGAGDSMTAACGGDWIMNVTEYFPGNSSFVLGIHRTQQDSPASRFILASFEQNSQDCDRAFVVKRWPGTDGGVANCMSSFYKPFLYSFTTRQAMITPKLYSGFSLHQGCENEGLSCYFKSFSPCKPTTNTTVLPTIDVMWMRHNFSFAIQGARALPLAWRESGWFWFVSQTVVHLWKLTADIQRRIDATRDAIGLGTRLQHIDGIGEPIRYIGLHVRHGDACTASEMRRTRRTCDPLAKYMVQAKKMREKYGLSRIFLATDDDSVLNETANFPDFVFHSQNASQAKRTPFAADHWADGAGTVKEKVVATLVDLILLSQASMLVGKFSSNMDRTAYALMSARCGGCFPPFASLDWKWCTDIGKQPASNSNGGQC